MTNLRATLAALLVAVAIASPTAAAAAPDAGEHFNRGVQLYKEYDYAGALVEFQRAYDVDPKYQVLFNIAESHYQLQDYANALKSFQRYLDDGGTQVPPKRRKDVEAEIATLSKRIATLTITTSEPGASISVDDRVIGTTPLEPLVVSAGRRKISATLPGRAPATTTIDLAGGDKKTVAMEIPPAPSAGGPAIAQPAGEVEEPSPIPMVVMWSVTGALTVGAVITGSLALGASSDVEDELARFPGNAAALTSASDSASTLGLVTDILIGSAVVSAGVATYFTVDYVLASEDGAAEEEEAAPASDDEAARMRHLPKKPSGSARVVVSPRGLAFAGTF